MHGPDLLAGADTALEAAFDAERRGAWNTAEEGFREAFALAVLERNVPALVDAVRGASFVRQQDGDFECSDELAELGITISDLHGLRASAARALNVVGINRFLVGDVREANAVWEECLERALEAGDGVLAGWTCQNLGIVASVRGELEEARTRYLECIATSTRTGETRGLVATYNNLAMLCTDLGDYAEALLYNDRGIELAERHDERPVLARLHTMRAEPLIRLNLHDAASAALETAEGLAAEVADDEILSTIFRLRATGSRLRGDLPAALTHVERALEIADGGDLKLARAEALAEWAEVLRAGGDLEPALHVVDRAVEEYRSLDAIRDVERLVRCREEWMVAGEEMCG